MNRPSLALDVRDLAGHLAVTRNPSDLLRLAKRLELLGTTLATLAATEAKRILDDETRQDLFA